MNDRLAACRLYLADLAHRQHEMEAGRFPMHALAYRVLSRRLREGLAGLPEPSLQLGFDELPGHLLPQLADVLETRHFEQHGRLFGQRAARCRDEANALMRRLTHRRAR